MKKSPIYKLKKANNNALYLAQLKPVERFNEIIDRILFARIKNSAYKLDLLLSNEY